MDHLHSLTSPSAAWQPAAPDPVGRSRGRTGRTARRGEHGAYPGPFMALALLTALASGILAQPDPSAAAPRSAGDTRAAQSASQSSSADSQRPFEMEFSEPGVYVQGEWHFRGNPGRVVSRDTVFTMRRFDYNEKTHTGVASGDPRIEDPHNVMTADKVTIIDAGPAAARKAILEGHVHVLHKPDGAEDTSETGDNLSDLFSRDVTLTCDQATYYYRTKTGSAEGNLLMAGQGTEENKTVPVTLTSKSLQFDQNRNTYRAVGDVVIHDGSRTITSPQMTAVSETKNGKRRIETIDLAPPIHMSGMFDDSTDTGGGSAAGPASASTGGAAGTTSGAAGSTGGTAGSTGGAAGSTGGTTAPAPANPAPATPAPATPAPATPAPATPSPAPPATPAAPARSPGKAAAAGTTGTHAHQG